MNASTGTSLSNFNVTLIQNNDVSGSSVCSQNKSGSCLSYRNLQSEDIDNDSTKNNKIKRKYVKIKL